MVHSTQLCFEFHWLLLHALVNCLENINKLIQFSFETELDLHICKLSSTDTQQSFFWPFAEPINRASIDQTREHTKSSGKGFSDWAHAHHNVNVSLDSCTIHWENVHFVWLEVLFCAVSFAIRHDVLHILIVVEVCNVTGVQDVVYILQHLLVDDLSVDKKEGWRFVLDTSC